MVDFTLTDEQQDLRELAHDFAEKEIRPVAWDYDRDGTWPQEIVEKAFEVGLMNVLEPLITHLSPFLVARVFIPLTSEPASGSVRQKEASFGSSVSIPRYFFFVSSKAPIRSGAEASPFAIKVVPMPAQPQPSSSSIRQPER